MILMYKHVGKCGYPQLKGVCEFVCAQWILKDSAHCYRQLNCSPVRAVWLPLNKQARSSTPAEEWQWGDIVPAKVRFKYHSTSQGRLVTFTTTAPAVLILLTLHNHPPSTPRQPPPSLFTSSIISLILKHLITLVHPSLSPERSALSSVQTIHSFLFRSCLSVRASFHLSISHISVTAIIPHVGKKNLGGGFGGFQRGLTQEA